MLQKWIHPLTKSQSKSKRTLLLIPLFLIFLFSNDFENHIIKIESTIFFFLIFLYDLVILRKKSKTMTQKSFFFLPNKYFLNYYSKQNHVSFYQKKKNLRPNNVINNNLITFHVKCSLVPYNIPRCIGGLARCNIWSGGHALS